MLKYLCFHWALDMQIQSRAPSFPGVSGLLPARGRTVVPTATTDVVLWCHLVVGSGNVGLKSELVLKLCHWLALFSVQHRGMTGLQRDHCGVCFQGEAISSLSRGSEEKWQLLWVWQLQTPGMFPVSSACMVGGRGRKSYYFGGGIRKGRGLYQDSLGKIRLCK